MIEWLDAHQEESAISALTLAELDKQGRAYMPVAFEKQILAATYLLEPGKKETLKLKAPSQPGEYEFVSTFPGHAVLMWGTLSVGK